MADYLLIAVNVGVPLVATLVEWVASSGISERHHSHHDTYVVSRTMSRVLVVTMIFMGALGVTLGWLCMMGVFNADDQVVLGFFASFVLVTGIMWSALRRYRVTTYDDHMEVRSFIGATRVVRYAEIEHLRWSSIRSIAGTRSVSVVAGGRVVAVLIGTVDLDQILLRINRNDIVER